jgi:hypothetical protein
MMSWNSYFKETFTLLAFNNFLAFETTGLIDFSLLIGNQLITYISGLLAVFGLLRSHFLADSITCSLVYLG